MRHCSLAFVDEISKYSGENYILWRIHFNPNKGWGLPRNIMERSLYFGDVVALLLWELFKRIE